MYTTKVVCVTTLATIVKARLEWQPLAPPTFTTSALSHALDPVQLRRAVAVREDDESC